MGRRRSLMNNAIPLENIKTNSIHEIETPPKQINLSDLGSMGKPSKLKIARFMSLVSVPEPSQSLKVSPSHFRVEKVGRFVDQYRTLDLIGKGGYGEVKKIEKSAILISLGMASEMLYKYISRIYFIKENTLEVKYKVGGDQLIMPKDDTTLIEYGLEVNSVLHIKGEITTDTKGMIDGFVDCGYNDDLNKAIQASLEENKAKKYDNMIECFHGEELSEEKINEKFNKAEKLIEEKMKEGSITVHIKSLPEIQISIDEIEQNLIDLIKDNK